MYVLNKFKASNQLYIGLITILYTTFLDCLIYKVSQKIKLDLGNLCIYHFEYSFGLVFFCCCFSLNNLVANLAREPRFRVAIMEQCFCWETSGTKTAETVAKGHCLPTIPW